MGTGRLLLVFINTNPTGVLSNPDCTQQTITKDAANGRTRLREGLLEVAGSRSLEALYIDTNHVMAKAMLLFPSVVLV